MNNLGWVIREEELGQGVDRNRGGSAIFKSNGQHTKLENGKQSVERQRWN